MKLTCIRFAVILILEAQEVVTQLREAYQQISLRLIFGWLPNEDICRCLLVIDENGSPTHLRHRVMARVLQ